MLPSPNYFDHVILFQAVVELAVVLLYRQKCLDAVNSLRDLLPELFDCSCEMKRHDTRERCERIQWRLANNTCLG